MLISQTARLVFSQDRQASKDLSDVHILLWRLPYFVFFFNVLVHVYVSVNTLLGKPIHIFAVSKLFSYYTFVEKHM